MEIVVSVGLAHLFSRNGNWPSLAQRVDAVFEHMGNVFRTHTAHVDARQRRKNRALLDFQTRPSASTRVVCPAGNGFLAQR
jgi:hypothetical protein